MFKSFFLWNWYEGLLNWQHVQSALQEKKRRQTWDDRAAHIRFETRRLAYKDTKWFSRPVCGVVLYTRHAHFAVPSLWQPSHPSVWPLSFPLQQSHSLYICSYKTNLLKQPFTSSFHHDLYSPISFLQLSPLMVTSEFSSRHRNRMSSKVCDASIERNTKQWCHWEKADIEQRTISALPEAASHCGL